MVLTRSSAGKICRQFVFKIVQNLHYIIRLIYAMNLTRFLYQIAFKSVAYFIIR